MHEVFVGAVWLLQGYRDRNALLFCEVNQVDASLEFVKEFLVFPRCIDLEIGGECCVGKLEANLVIAFAGRAMADVVCAILTCYFDLLFGDNWSGQRRTEQVTVLVECVSRDRWEDIILYELTLTVDDDYFVGTGNLSVFPDLVEIFILAHIGNVGDNPKVFKLKPLEDATCVETTGIGEND